MVEFRMTQSSPDGAQEAMQECVDIAMQYDDCGGEFIAQKIRDRILALQPATPTATGGDTKMQKEAAALADKIEYAIKTEGEITLFQTNGTRAVYALRCLADNDLLRAALKDAEDRADLYANSRPVVEAATPTEPVGWMAHCAKTGGRLFAHTEQTARIEGKSIYAEHGFTVTPLFTACDSKDLSAALAGSNMFSRTSGLSHQIVIDFPNLEAMQIARDAIIKASVPEVRAFANSGGVAQRPPELIQEVAATAIRTFCQNLGAHTVAMSSGVERIYYPGLSIDALAVAVALALSSTEDK